MTKQETQQAEVTTEQDVQTQPTAEEKAAVQQEAEASFASGFGKVNGTPVANDPEAGKPDATTTTVATTEAAPATEVADVEQPVLAGLTESQIKATLAQVGELTAAKDRTEKELRKVFGRFGDIQSQLTTAHAGLGKREVNTEALKKFKDEYPEIAELVEPLLMGLPTAGPGITQEQVDAHVNKAVSEGVTNAVRELNVEMLSRFHSDWETIRDSDDLQLWLGTQAPGYRDKFLDSSSAVFIAGGLDKFKAWKEQGQSTRQQSTSRLERAIAPKGRSAPGAPAVSDQAAFASGFNRVRGG